MTDAPTSTTSGRSDGHALHRISSTSGLTPSTGHVTLLQTPLHASEFAGTPYPAPAAIVRAPNPPPWLVVNHSIERMTIARWPVRLWEVNVIEPAEQGDQISDWYTRAVAVEVLREIAASVLFGDHGDAVALVIEVAGHLRQWDASTLAASRDRAAGRVYNALWERWSAGDRWGSPVGHGLILVHRAVNDAARTERDGLFRHDDVDGVDVLADPTWVDAEKALLEAAVAFGAPEFAADRDVDVLLGGWRGWRGD